MSDDAQPAGSQLHYIEAVFEGGRALRLYNLSNEGMADLWQLQYQAHKGQRWHKQAKVRYTNYADAMQAWLVDKARLGRGLEPTITEGAEP